ncbi:MAG: thioredoxin family protein [Chloroflexi bacterium]|nr:thioredoxin family protein [Chloroflexota bacterium]
MAEKKSVVTRQRFASGFTYKDYIAQIKVNKDKFEEYYQTAQLSNEDKEFFRKVAGMPDGAAKVLVLGEDWCPDAFRGIPLIARIAETAGMEMRIFPRDLNLDIMNEFLNQGQFMSLPTVVFYTKDQQYICHWIERPEFANQDRAKIEAEIKKKNPAGSEQEIRTLVGESTRARYPVWQQESAREIRQMLGKKLGI